MLRDHLVSQSCFTLLYVRPGLDRLADAPHRFLKVVCGAARKGVLARPSSPLI
jgi:hypothetical protein